MPAPISRQIKHAAGKSVGRVFDQAELSLLRALRKQVTDPRARRGRRYEGGSLLTHLQSVMS